MSINFKSKMWSKSIIILLTIMSMFVVSTQILAAKDDDKNEDDYSFYKVSSAASSYYDETHNPKSDKLGDWEFDIAASTAGAFMGFVDEDYDDGFFGATVSYLSSSSQARGYEAYPEIEMTQYMVYGHALSDMGLDSTANESFDMGAIVRLIAGGIMLIAYTLALSVDALFAAIINILITLNPFRLLIGADSFFKSDEVGIESPDGALSGLADAMGDLYDVSRGLGLLLIPIFFAGLVFSILLVKGSEGTVSKLRKYVTRVAFIVLGIPLLGATYTSVLDTVACTTTPTTGPPSVEQAGSTEEVCPVNSGNPNANFILSSTFVDFEAWASTNHLALPDGKKIYVDRTNSAAGQVDIGKSENVRSLSRAINSDSGAGLGVEVDDIDSWNDGVNSTSTGSYSDSVASGYNLLNRYMKSAYYHSSDFETDYKAKWTTTDGNRDKLFDEIENWSDRKNYKEESELPEGTFLRGYKGTTALGAESQDNGDIKYTGPAKIEGKNKDVIKDGMSGLSMYNYLTTTFGDTSVVVYSSNKATSGFVKQAHHSVNLVGSGVTQAMYYFNSLIMFSTMTIIGYCYALGMLIGVLKNNVRIFTAVPLATMGSLKAMARITTIIVITIMEIIGTLFVYGIVVQLLVASNTIIEKPISDSMSGVFGSIIPNSNPAVIGASLTLVLLLVTAVFNLWFMIMAIKLRKSIIKTLNEGVSSWIDRLFMTDGVAGQAAGVNKPNRLASAGKALAGGVATGAGMAGAQALTSKGSQLLKGATAGSTEGVLKGGASNPTDGSDGVKNTGGETVSGDDSKGKELLQSDADSITNVNNEASNKVDSKDIKQIKSDDKFDEMSGTKSAMDSRADDDMKSAKRKEAIKGTAKGGVQAAAGAGEVAAGIYSGNAEVTKDGVKNLTKGSEKAKNGISNTSNVSGEVARQSQKRQEAGKTINSSSKTSGGTANTSINTRSNNINNSAGNSTQVNQGNNVNLQSKQFTNNKSLNSQNVRQLRRNGGNLDVNRGTTINSNNVSNNQPSNNMVKQIDPVVNTSNNSTSNVVKKELSTKGVDAASKLI